MLGYTVLETWSPSWHAWAPRTHLQKYSDLHHYVAALLEAESLSTLSPGKSSSLCFTSAPAIQPMGGMHCYHLTGNLHCFCLIAIPCVQNVDSSKGAPVSSATIWHKHTQQQSHHNVPSWVPKFRFTFPHVACLVIVTKLQSFIDASWSTAGNSSSEQTCLQQKQELSQHIQTLKSIVDSYTIPTYHIFPSLEMGEVISKPHLCSYTDPERAVCSFTGSPTHQCLPHADQQQADSLVLFHCAFQVF